MHAATPAAKDLIGLAVGPVLATGSGLLLVLAQDVGQGGVSTQVLTVVASVLASTGVVGYAIKRFVDNQVARAEEERAQDREARRIANEHIERMFNQAERHAERMEQMYLAERTRNEQLVMQVVSKQSVGKQVVEQQVVEQKEQR
jgi:hypothetical protein